MEDLLLQSEGEAEAEVHPHHRVIIAAAAAAVLGDRIRILGIRPVSETARATWMRRNRTSIEIARRIIRQRAAEKPKSARRVSKSEAPNQG